MRIETIAGGAMILGLLGGVSAEAVEVDPYLWLEEIDSARSLEWVRPRNERTLSLLRSDPRFASVERDIRAIALAQDRIPMPGQIEDGYVYNFWQDAQHVRGIWRRVPLAGYSAQAPAWEIVLDVDRLASDEHENWVYKGANCHSGRCLISLSRGGGDAVVIREFDLETREFVADGFALSEAKSGVTWIDRDNLLVGTDFGAGSLTSSGYPRIVKSWARGTPITLARTVYEGQVSDVEIWPYVIHRPEGARVFVSRAMTFYTSEAYEVAGATGAAPTVSKLEVPNDASLLGVFEGQAVLSLRTPWAVGGTTYASGSVISIPAIAGAPTEASLIYAPTDRASFASLAMTSDALYLQVLENVKGRVIRVQRTEGAWRLSDVSLPDFGSVSLLSSSPIEAGLLVSYESFLTPTSVYRVDAPGSAGAALVQQARPRFDASPFEIRQHEAESKDGTKIPYFVVSKRGIALDGSNPTLLYGYGGFEISMTPSYLGSTGKAWLERGGVYVLANIRGGGEFGPEWHQAALLENRQKAFDDFIAVAESLIALKITSPRHLGIQGGSNGGLLVGAVMTQRPELFNAVICQVPLLDMLRYHLLLAGASWMAEYGDPTDPRMEQVIRAYSPYQNVSADKTYPMPFFMTSTRDDRVHPGHARKMVARMEELGHPVLMYENTEGGHGGSANIEQSILQGALRMTYLYQRLMN